MARHSVFHCNSNTWETRQGDHKLKISQGYKERPLQKEGIYALIIKMQKFYVCDIFIISEYLNFSYTFIIRMNSKFIAKSYDNIC